MLKEEEIPKTLPISYGGEDSFRASFPRQALSFSLTHSGTLNLTQPHSLTQAVHRSLFAVRIPSKAAQTRNRSPKNEAEKEDSIPGKAIHCARLDSSLEKKYDCKTTTTTVTAHTHTQLKNMR